MTIRSDLQHLWVSLHTLRDAVLAVRLTVAEDRPDDVHPQPVDALADRVDDVFGLLQEGVEAAGAALRASDDPRRLDQVVRMLARCHQRVIDLGHCWATEVSSPDRQLQLASVASERGGRWWVWVQGVVEAGAGCEAPLSDVRRALLRCWENLADHCLVSRVAVRASQSSEPSSAATEEG